MTELGDWLERHEETGNAESARRIGGDIWRRGDALVITSHPDLGTGLNFACRVRADADSIDRLIDDVSAWLSARRAVPHFRVSPFTRPSNLAQLLEQRGFVRTETETQMVLATQDAETPANPRVTVEQIDMSEIEPWVTIQLQGFGIATTTSLAVDLARAAVAVSGISPFRARLDGVAAGAGMLIAWDGVCGIYGVATVPAARRQGVGTALVRAMIQAARARGSMPICLQVETGSAIRRWYDRLGFRAVYDREGWTAQEHKTRT